MSALVAGKLPLMEGLLALEKAFELVLALKKVFELWYTQKEAWIEEIQRLKLRKHHFFLTFIHPLILLFK